MAATPPTTSALDNANKFTNAASAAPSPLTLLGEALNVSKELSGATMDVQADAHNFNDASIRVLSMTVAETCELIRTLGYGGLRTWGCMSCVQEQLCIAYQTSAIPSATQRVAACIAKIEAALRGVPPALEFDKHGKDEADQIAVRSLLHAIIARLDNALREMKNDQDASERKTVAAASTGSRGKRDKDADHQRFTFMSLFTSNQRRTSSSGGAGTAAVTVTPGADRGGRSPSKGARSGGAASSAGRPPRSSASSLKVQTSGAVLFSNNSPKKRTGHALLAGDDDAVNAEGLQRANDDAERKSNLLAHNSGDGGDGGSEEPSRKRMRA